MKGDIIFLNGATSSGKTSLAQCLQRKLDRLYLHVSFDHFITMLPERFRLGGDENWETVNAEWGSVLPVLLPGFNRTIAALAASGNNLIVDHVLLGEYNARQCALALAGESALFVGIDCPLAELKLREERRGDRPKGLVAYQFEHVHVPGIYDLRLDTSQSSPEECADRIISALDSGTRREAFERLRSPAS